MNRKEINLIRSPLRLMLTAYGANYSGSCHPKNGGENRKEGRSLAKKMTSLEEKIGQMTELTIDVITKRDNSTQEFQIDDAFTGYRYRQIQSRLYPLNCTPGCCPIKRSGKKLIPGRYRTNRWKVMVFLCIYGVETEIHGTTYTLGGTFSSLRASIWQLPSTANLVRERCPPSPLMKPRREVSLDLCSGARPGT